MNELVFKGTNNQVLTNSLLVAEKFGKEHRRVMQDNLLESTISCCPRIIAYKTKSCQCMQ